MKRLDVGNIKIMLQLMINKSKFETKAFLKMVLDLIQSQENEINDLKQKLNNPD